MQVVTGYRDDAGEASSFLRRAQSVLTVLGDCISWRSGYLGHVVDDPTLWVRTGEYVGSHQYAFSASEVEMSAKPLFGRALDEPTAFELVSDLRGTGSPAADVDRR